MSPEDTKAKYTRKGRDWKALTRRWVAGEWKTLRECAKKTKIPIGTLNKQAIRHKWILTTNAVEAKADAKVEEAAVKSKTEMVKEMRERHRLLGRVAQGQAVNRIRQADTKLNPVQLLKVGVEIERETVPEVFRDKEQIKAQARGVGPKAQSAAVVQVNVGAQAKSKEEELNTELTDEEKRLLRQTQDIINQHPYLLE